MGAPFTGFLQTRLLQPVWPFQQCDWGSWSFWPQLSRSGGDRLQECSLGSRTRPAHLARSRVCSLVLTQGHTWSVSRGLWSSRDICRALSYHHHPPPPTPLLLFLIPGWEFSPDTGKHAWPLLSRTPAPCLLSSAFPLGLATCLRGKSSGSCPCSLPALNGEETFPSQIRIISILCNPPARRQEEGHSEDRGLAAFPRLIMSSC